MEKINLDADVAMRLLEECVAERGEDYVYSSPGEDPENLGNCINWHGDEETGEPGCIVGLALHKLGVPARVLRGCAEYTISSLLPQLQTTVECTDAARRILAIAQVIQDDRKPWGLALERAREVHKNETENGGK